MSFFIIQSGGPGHLKTWVISEPSHFIIGGLLLGDAKVDVEASDLLGLGRKEICLIWNWCLIVIPVMMSSLAWLNNLLDSSGAHASITSCRSWLKQWTERYPSPQDFCSLLSRKVIFFYQTAGHPRLILTYNMPGKWNNLTTTLKLAIKTDIFRMVLSGS